MLGKTVRQLRKQDKITQRQLAHVAGVSVAALSRLEKNGQWPGSAYVLDSILGALAHLSPREQVQSTEDVWYLAVLALREHQKAPPDSA